MMGLLCRLGKKIKDDKKLDRTLDFAVFVLRVTAFCHISQSCCLLPASFLCFTTNISNHIVKCPQRSFESFKSLKSLDLSDQVNKKQTLISFFKRSFLCYFVCVGLDIDCSIL